MSKLRLSLWACCFVKCEFFFSSSVLLSLVWKHCYPVRQRFGNSVEKETLTGCQHLFKNQVDKQETRPKFLTLHQCRCVVILPPLCEPFVSLSVEIYWKVWLKLQFSRLPGLNQQPRGIWVWWGFVTWSTVRFRQNKSDSENKFSYVVQTVNVTQLHFETRDIFHWQGRFGFPVWFSASRVDVSNLAFSWNSSLGGVKSSRDIWRASPIARHSILAYQRPNLGSIDNNSNFQIGFHLLNNKFTCSCRGGEYADRNCFTCGYQISRLLFYGWAKTACDFLVTYRWVPFNSNEDNPNSQLIWNPMEITKIDFSCVNLPASFGICLTRKNFAWC